MSQPVSTFNKAITVTPSDSLNLDDFRARGALTDALYVGTGGTLTVVFQDDSTQQFTVPSGALLPFAVKRVNSTGTAALLIVALYQR